MWQMAVGMALQAGAQVYSAVEGYKASQKEAAALRREGDWEYEDYLYQAAIARDEGYRTEQTQAMDYIGAGVEIQGTPLLVLHETAKITAFESKQLETKGSRIHDLYNEKAKQVLREGKAKLISGLVGATGSAMSGMGQR